MNSPSPKSFSVIVMGVSGCGKSTVGALLADSLGAQFIEGDQFHPAENVSKMAAGQPLTDEDRYGWLHVLSNQLKLAHNSQRSVVMSCSALKESYRDILRMGAPNVWLVYLHASFDVLNERVTARSHQYMPASLLQSQLATLEPPTKGPRVLSYEVTTPAADIVVAVKTVLLGQSTPQSAHEVHPDNAVTQATQ
jgi:carbohydrate kinase (thermoresistant glucokinase family)